MKILSTNIRGLGSIVKKKEILGMRNKFKFDFCCIQETKLDSLDESVCRQVWGEGNFDWAARDAVGRAGGILCIWNSDKFLCSSSWHMEGSVGVCGVWGAERTRCCIINIYDFMSFE